MGIDVEFAVMRAKPYSGIGYKLNEFLSTVLDQLLSPEDLEIELYPVPKVGYIVGKGVVYWLAGDVESGRAPLHTDYPERCDNARRILEMVPSVKVPLAWVEDGEYFTLVKVEELVNFDYNTVISEPQPVGAYPFLYHHFKPIIDHCQEQKWQWLICRFTDTYNLRR